MSGKNMRFQSSVREKISKSSKNVREKVGFLGLSQEISLSGSCGNPGYWTRCQPSSISFFRSYCSFEVLMTPLKGPKYLGSKFLVFLFQVLSLGHKNVLNVM